ncbi:MAG TPA: succinylglutamate desuccinylase/aspartoacylase family protein [Acetobacteraceae bacterium]|nr:succinylglutamate desuccinylase/aspartoacylase family protein [Acetobacteraceae bacterium]
MPEPVQPPLPHFDVRLTAPDISPWREGNTGIPGFTTYAAPRPGPHLLLVALAHGNEIAGAIVLDRLLRDGLRPSRGRLTFGFLNLAAFDRFDPRQPTLSRFVDEDINRVWDEAVLDGPRQSSELARAREVRPLIDTVDMLLDLHSMLWPSDPLMLCGGSEKGRRMAAGIGIPELVVADHGHLGGRRMIDYGRFIDPETSCAANLIEAGQHWVPATVETTMASVARLLHWLEMTPPTLATPPRKMQHFAEVTVAVTAATSGFSFVQPWRGGDVIARRNTLIAFDGNEEVRTPHDECLLVMPSLRPSRGHTAVRLARFA